MKDSVSNLICGLPGTCAQQAQGLKAEGPSCSACWQGWGRTGGWEVGSNELQFCLFFLSACSDLTDHHLFIKAVSPYHQKSKFFL